MKLLEFFKKPKTETPPSSTPQDPLARIKTHVTEYEKQFNEQGQAPWKDSFGTLTPEELKYLIARYTRGGEILSTGFNSVAYNTCLVDQNGKPLFFKRIGDFGAQIDALPPSTSPSSKSPESSQNL